jgi:hypothetical protein
MLTMLVLGAIWCALHSVTSGELIPEKCKE